MKWYFSVVDITCTCSSCVSVTVRGWCVQVWMCFEDRPILDSFRRFFDRSYIFYSVNLHAFASTTRKWVKLNTIWWWFWYFTAFGQHILQLFACIPWFLEPEYSDTIPHTVASTLAIFPSTLQKETVELLCTILLPLCLSKWIFKKILFVCLPHIPLYNTKQNKSIRP